MSLTRHPLCTAQTVGPLGLVPEDRGAAEALRRSFGVLAEPDRRLAARFYERVFAVRPEVRAMFPDDLTGQCRKLMEALGAVVRGLHDTASLRVWLHELGRAHAGYGVKPAHYPPVIDAMLGAMAEAGGHEWTPALHAEWRRALTLVCALMLEGGGLIGDRAAAGG